MKEFVEIEGYPNYYIAHSPPRVVRKDERGVYVCKQTRNSKKDNYWTVTLKNGEGVYKKVSVHRLLMLTFVPNPENKAHVNHKDGDKSNNSMDNLEWATPKENFRHAVEIGLVNPNEPVKEVHKYDLSGKYLCSYDGVSVASKELGIEQANIASCARGVRRTAGDFRWSYTKESRLEPLDKKYVKHYEYKGKIFLTLKELAEHLGKSCANKIGIKNFSKKEREAITTVYKN